MPFGGPKCDILLCVCIYFKAALIKDILFLNKIWKDRNVFKMTYVRRIVKINKLGEFHDD